MFFNSRAEGGVYRLVPKSGENSRLEMMPWVEQLRTVDVWELLGSALGAYALGCVATGYYLVRARTGRDIREIASGNIGARNVSRVLGQTGFVLTFLGDFGKGALAVWATRYFSGNDLLPAIAMISVVAGHLWPVTLRFHGGKGAATSLGALLVYDPHLALAFIVCCLPGVLVLRKITLPGMVAFACLPGVSYWMHRDPAEPVLLGILGALVIFAHRQNLLKEFQGMAARFTWTAKSHSPKP